MSGADLPGVVQMVRTHSARLRCCQELCRGYGEGEPCEREQTSCEVLLERGGADRARSGCRAWWRAVPGSER